jgi:hypothetical protein
MSTSRALTDRAELFIATATIAAHSTYNQEGFRQRDVRFYVELFSNWVELSFEKYSLSIQNTQLQRYLNNLVEQNLAKKISKKSPPHYRLTKSGFIELITRAVKKNYISQPEHFFFLYYFLKNYREQLLELVRSAGPEFTNTDRIDIESLLDIQKLLHSEIDEVKKCLARQKLRISDAHLTVKHVKKSISQKKSLLETVKEVQKAYPYELNSQKPLSELINQIPEEQRLWELTEGNLSRIQEVWTPGLALLELYDRLLRRLNEN